MITNLNEFRKFLETYQAKEGDTFIPFSKHDQAKLASKTLDDSSIDSLATISRDNTNIKPPKNIKQLDGAKRLLYRDVNPELKRMLDINAIDVVYEIDLGKIPVFSTWLSDNSEDVNPLLKGEALYYGWLSGTEFIPPHYFVLIVAIDNKGHKGHLFRNVHELRSPEEMYDIVEELQYAIQDQLVKGEIDYIDPDRVTGGRMSDDQDFY